jgi:hypothetical protein
MSEEKIEVVDTMSEDKKEKEVVGLTEGIIVIVLAIVAFVLGLIAI